MIENAMQNIVERAQRAAMRNNAVNFDRTRYIENLWLLFLCADMAQTATLELEQQLRSSGGYRMEDKMIIERMKKLSGKFITDVDRTCTNDFACDFGDLADEVRVLVVGYIGNKIKSVKPERKCM